MNRTEEIIAIIERHGSKAYGGERVSQREHALQAAYLAEQEGRPDALVVAALLHDIGHLLDGGDQGLAEQGIDASHEEVASQWLADRFGPEVTEPIRLHVDAKRYLCAVEPGYIDQLSAASVTSLNVQGGPFTADEVASFEESPFVDDAVSLRRWDDRAKTPGLQVPDLEHYRARLEAVSAAEGANEGG